MAKKRLRFNKKLAGRITTWSICGVLGAFILISVIFSLVDAGAGLKAEKGAEIKQIQVLSSKAGKAGDAIGKQGGENIKTLMPNESDKDYEIYKKTVKAYKKLCSYSAARGILEGKWFPSPKAVTKERTDKSDKDTEYDYTMTKGILDELKADTDEYLMIVTYDKVTTRKLKNSSGKKTEVKFDCVVLKVTESKNKNVISNVDLYVFVAGEHDNVLVDGSGGAEGYFRSRESHEQVGYKVAVKALRDKLYETCKSQF